VRLSQRLHLPRGEVIMPEYVKIARAVAIVAIIGGSGKYVQTASSPGVVLEFAGTQITGDVVQPPRTGIFALSRGPGLPIPMEGEEQAMAALSHMHDLTGAMHTSPDMPLPGNEIVAELGRDQRGVISDAVIDGSEGGGGQAPALATTCNMLIAGSAQAGGMAALVVDAPCLAGRDLTIAQGDMGFTATMPAAGVLTITIPAMSGHATFTATAEDGASIGLDMDFPELAGMRRVALGWSGETGLSLEAHETTAGGGAEVWRYAPHSQVPLEGGYVMALGSTHGRQLEIYTFPQDAAQVDLTVEASVGPQTCDRVVRGQTFTVGDDGAVAAKDLSVALPACDLAGDFLELPDLYPQAALAAN
jgi:hypothetical protein